MLNINSNRALGRAAVGTVIGVGILAASPAFGQEVGSNPPDRSSPGVIVQLQFPGGTLEAFVELLRAEVERIPINVLYRNGAEFAEIPSVRLRNIYVRTALQSVIYGLTLDFDMIEGRFGSNVYVITSEAEEDSGISVELSRATEVLNVGDIFAQGSTEIIDVLEAIDVAVYDEKRPDHRPKIRFHEQSGMLIVQGTPSQVGLARLVVDYLSEDVASKQGRVLQQASDRIRLEAEVSELQAQVHVAVELLEMARANRSETVLQHSNGLASAQNVDESHIASIVKKAELDIAKVRLRAAEAQLDLFNRAGAGERTWRTYEIGSITGAGDRLPAFLAAIGALRGPAIKGERIKVGPTDNELTVNATPAQHAVVAAAIEAMKAAASKDPQ